MTTATRRDRRGGSASPRRWRSSRSSQRWSARSAPRNGSARPTPGRRRTLPSALPERTWYTPLVLSNHRPESLSVTLPCRLAAPLSETDTPTTVIATARKPDRVEGLEITRVDEALDIRLGGVLLHRLPLGAERLNGSSCANQLRMADKSWFVANTAGDLIAQGDIESLPFVSGLFSGVDLRSENAPSIVVTTTVHATRTTTRQESRGRWRRWPLFRPSCSFRSQSVR